MNNSLLSIESVDLSYKTPNNSTVHIEREGELIAIIEAVHEIQKSKAWSVLSDKVFSGLTESLAKELTYEAKKETPDTLKLNRITGQLIWAERYSDLKKLEQRYASELISIKNQLYGKKE